MAYEVPMRGVLDLVAIWKLRQIFKTFRADIVNSHSSGDTQIVGLAARTLSRRPKLVRTRHLALPITSLYTYSVLPDHVVTVSRYVTDYLVSAGLAPEKVTTVPTGIDFERYYSDLEIGSLKRELGLDDDQLLVGTVAILRHKKGHLDLLDAIPLVLDKFPNAHFVFAGDGPQFDNLVQRISDANLRNCVHLLGLRRDVVNILQSLDLFVLPTHQEALGTAFIEAAAMSCPVVGTRVDGVPEVVIDGETGLLVPPHNGNELAFAIIALLGDPVRRKRMGQAGKTWVLKQFSRQAMVTGMEALYKRLLLQ
jgi:glycosyltransferase involved in cell wall biosynthesis